MKRTRFGRALVAALWTMVAGAAQASSSNPPDFYPGMAGMASCMTCHDSYSSFGGPGQATIEGLPAGFDPGAVYTVTVKVKQAGAKKFGFSLYAVDQSAQQAGRILSNDTKQDVRVAKGVSFVKSSFQSVDADGEQSWTFRWRAPEDPNARVGFYGEAVAADGHGSVLDDRVYRMEAVVPASGAIQAEAPESGADVPGSAD